MTNLLETFVPRVPHGPAESRMRRSVMATLGAILASWLLVALSEPTLRIQGLSAACAALTLACAAPIIRGSLTAARVGYPAILFVALTTLTLTGGGLNGVAVTGYPLVSGLAMILLSVPATVLSAACCSVTVMAVAYATSAGMLPSVEPPTVLFEDAIQLNIVHFMLVFVMVLVRRHADEDRRIIEASQQELLTTNARLQSQTEALQQSEARYKLLADNVSDVVWTTDMELNQVYCSPSVIHQRGFTPEEMASLGVDEQVSADTREKLLKAYEETLLSAREDPSRLPASQTFEYKVLCKDGSEKWVEAVVSFLYDDDGKPELMIGVSRDIADRKSDEDARKQLELQVQQMQKLDSLGLMAGGIAHDFNNLLTGVMGNAELALSSMPETNTAARENVEKIVQSARRAADLCQQLLAYSGRGRFVVQPIDLCALVEDMGSLLSAPSKDRCQLHFDLPAGLPAVEADASQLRQVVINLVLNAADAMPERGGDVIVSVQRSDGQETRPHEHLLGVLPGLGSVVLEVSDNGRGMDQVMLERIFDPFFTTKATGHGLGLAAVLGIVRGHDGAVGIQSTPGTGTTVRVYLPKSERPAVPTVQSTTPDGEPATKGRVLIIDDESAVRDVLRSALMKRGMNVVTAETGSQGVERFRDQPDTFDLVLLDMTMPGMDGAATLQALREISPDVRAILMSGFSEQEAISRFTEAEPLDFIQKPFQLDDVLAKIDAVIASNKTRGA